MPRMRPDDQSLAMDEVNILLIESDADSAELVRVALRSLPVLQRVKHCRDTGAALAWLEGDGARLAPNAFALLDPGLATNASCAPIVALRRAPGLSALPIVVLVGSGDPFSIAAAYRCGVNSVVQRPFDPTEFAAAVQQVAAYWLLRNVCALEQED